MTFAIPSGRSLAKSSHLIRWTLYIAMGPARSKEEVPVGYEVLCVSNAKLTLQLNLCIIRLVKVLADQGNISPPLPPEKGIDSGFSGR